MKKYLSILLLLAPLFVFGQTQIKLDHINPIMPADWILTGHNFGAANAYFGGVTVTPPTATKIVSLGNSIAAGAAGLSNVSKRYTTVLCAMGGYTELNFGASGKTIESRTPPSPSGGTGLCTTADLANIPTYDNTYAALLIEGGINDVDANTLYPSQYNLTNFNTDYTTILNNAITTKGWPPSKIILISTFLRNNPSTSAYQVSINSAISALAASFGTKFLDIYTLMTTHGGLYLSEYANAGNTGTGTHPNDAGDLLTAQELYGLINPIVYLNSQSTASNGPVEFNNLIYKNYNVLADDNLNYVLGVNNSGIVAPMPAIPANFKYNGIMNIMGSIIQNGAMIPIGANSQDIILKGTTVGVGTPSRILSGYNTSIFNSIEMSDAGNNLNIRNNHTGSTIDFYGDNGGGTGTLLTLRLVNGLLKLGGASSSGSNAGDMFQPNGAQIWSVNSSNNSVFGRLTLMDATNLHTTLLNNFANGKIRLFVSGGSNGGSLEAFNVFQSGRVVTQNGGAFTDNGTDQMQIGGSIISGKAGTTLGTYNLAGNTSGTISIKPQAAAGTYEFDMPITAGFAGQMLTSQGGAGTAQTYTYPISKPHNISTPTTGGTVSLTNNQYNIINPAGSLVALTVALPSSPANNDCVYIKYTQAVTTVTYSGGTVVDGITAPTAGGLVVLTYDSGTTSWY